MLDIQCTEQVNTIREFAKSENIEDVFQEMLDYLRSFTTGCVTTIYYKFVPNSLGVEIKTRDGKTLWVGDAIYDSDRKLWDVIREKKNKERQ